MEINVLVEEDFSECLEADWLERVAEKVLVIQSAGPRAELSLVITGQERVHRLNLRYLDEDRPTDVLAFPMLPEQPESNTVPFVVPPDGITHLGEVIIAYPQAVIQAEEHQHSVKRELAILIIHGVLHLLGYDHDRPEPERQMRDREAEILNLVEGEMF